MKKKRVLAITLARGGSKEVKKKILRKLIKNLLFGTQLKKH